MERPVGPWSLGSTAQPRSSGSLLNCQSAVQQHVLQLKTQPQDTQGTGQALPSLQPTLPILPSLSLARGPPTS